MALNDYANAKIALEKAEESKAKHSKESIFYERIISLLGVIYVKEKSYDKAAQYLFGAAERIKLDTLPLSKSDADGATDILKRAVALALQLNQPDRLKQFQDKLDKYQAKYNPKG